MKRKTLWLLASVLAIGLIAAGCGGDDDGDDNGGAAADAPTKQEYIAEADRICTEADGEIEQDAEEVFGEQQAPSREELESFVSDTYVPKFRDQIQELRDLTPPEGDEDAVEAIYDAADEGINEIDDDPGVLFDQAEGERAFGEAGRLAREYGLEVCGAED